MKTKYEIIKKAWTINAENIKLEYPVFKRDNVWYGTRGQAKTQACIDFDGFTDDEGRELTILNIKVSRWKHADIINYNGNHIKRNQIAHYERQEKIKSLDDDKKYFLQDSRNYVGNSVLWWALGSEGYTTDIAKAEKYTAKEIKEKSLRETDVVWDSEHVEKNIKSYVDMQCLNNYYKI